MENKRPRFNEDWLSVYIGLLVFALSMSLLLGADLLGWAVKTSVWTDVMSALKTVSRGYGGLPGSIALLATYAFLLAILCAGVAPIGVNVRRFAKGFTVVFFVSYLCWIIGSWAYIAATPDQLSKFGIRWSLNLTPEAGFIVALLVGLLVGNFLPSAAAALKEAIRPELYVKTAIVILGGALGVTAAEQISLATAVMFQGVCAILVAYLIFWAVVYYVARRYFRFSREWAAPLASGASRRRLQPARPSRRGRSYLSWFRRWW